MAARREEDLGGGRASWLVPFDVISRNTNKPPATRKREKKKEEVGKAPPPKGSPPPGSNEGRGEKRLRKRGESLRRERGRRKDVDERKK